MSCSHVSTYTIFFMVVCTFVCSQPLIVKVKTPTSADTIELRLSGDSCYRSELFSQLEQYGLAEHGHSIWKQLISQHKVPLVNVSYSLQFDSRVMEKDIQVCT